MTVAQVREQADHAEVAFFESARIYKLPRENPAYDEALRLLRGAMTTGRVLNVGFASAESDIIETVHG